MFPNDGVSDGFLTSGVFFHHQINFYLLDLKAQWVRFSTIQWSESTLQTVISHWIPLDLSSTSRDVQGENHQTLIRSSFIVVVEQYGRLGTGGAAGYVNIIAYC